MIVRVSAINNKNKVERNKKRNVSLSLRNCNQNYFWDLLVRIWAHKYNFYIIFFFCCCLIFATIMIFCIHTFWVVCFCIYSMSFFSYIYISWLSLSVFPLSLVRGLTLFFALSFSFTLMVCFQSLVGIVYQSWFAFLFEYWTTPIHIGMCVRFRVCICIYDFIFAIFQILLQMVERCVAEKKQIYIKSPHFTLYVCVYDDFSLYVILFIFPSFIDSSTCLFILPLMGSSVFFISCLHTPLHSSFHVSLERSVCLVHINHTCIGAIC